MFIPLRRIARPRTRASDLLTGTRSEGPARRQKIAMLGGIGQLVDLAARQRTKFDMQAAKTLKKGPERPRNDCCDGLFKSAVVVSVGRQDHQPAVERKRLR